MNVNWKRFAGLFLLFNVALLLSGCGPVTWISDAIQIITIVSGMASGILTLISALAPGVLPVAVAALIAGIISKLMGGLTDIENAVNEYKSNPQPTTLTKIEELVQVAIDNATSFLNDTGITNAALQGSIVKILNLILQELKSFQSMLPAFTAKAGEKLTIVVPMTSKEAKDAYNRILSEPTGDPAVDKALAGVPRL
jgi:hypothetical protein